MVMRVAALTSITPSASAFCREAVCQESATDAHLSTLRFRETHMQPVDADTLETANEASVQEQSPDDGSAPNR